MDDEKSCMSTVEGSVAGLAAGTETEVVRIEGTELYLLVGKRVSVMRKGELSVRVVRQEQSPLLAAFCMVGDHQWPLGIDSPVLRLGLRRFSFALPGFLYGLALADKRSEDQLKRLEETLIKFSTYQTHSLPEKQQDFDDSMPEIETDFWSSASSMIEDLRNQMLAKISCEELKTELAVEKSNEDMHSKAQKAIRMSAIAKLVSKALVKGAINSNYHVNMVEAKESDTWALASIRAFADVMDAIETAGLSIMDGHRRGGMLSSGVSYWNFNKSGLALLLRAVAASAVIHVRRSSVGRDLGCLLKSEGTGLSSMSSSDSIEKPMEACGI